jgi:hypothetical protein
MCCQHHIALWQHLRANRSPPNVSSHIAAVSPPANALQHEASHEPVHITHAALVCFIMIEAFVPCTMRL